MTYLNRLLKFSLIIGLMLVSGIAGQLSQGFKDVKGAEGLLVSQYLSAYPDQEAQVLAIKAVCLDGFRNSEPVNRDQLELKPMVTKQECLLKEGAPSSFVEAHKDLEEHFFNEVGFPLSWFIG